jgi:hypothetical protein
MGKITKKISEITGLDKMDELKGIDAISGYTKKSHSELIRLRVEDRFPMFRVENVWHAKKSDIKKWRAAEQERRLSRPLPPEFSRDLEGIEEICKFFHEQLHQIVNWVNQYGDACPIRRGVDRVYRANAGELQKWLESQKLRSGPYMRPTQEDHEQNTRFRRLRW